MELNHIISHYRLYLSRMHKQSTREDYSKRLEMLVRYATMHSITTNSDFNVFIHDVSVQEID